MTYLNQQDIITAMQAAATESREKYTVELYVTTDATEASRLNTWLYRGHRIGSRIEEFVIRHTAGRRFGYTVYVAPADAERARRFRDSIKWEEES